MEIEEKNELESGATHCRPLSPNGSRRVLYLPLKRRWFEAIKDGTKTEEYRLCTEFWRKRLYKKYDEIEFSLGYPKRDDASRRMRFKFGGVYRREVTSPEWGNEPREVYAIRIGDAVASERSEGAVGDNSSN